MAQAERARTPRIRRRTMVAAVAIVALGSLVMVGDTNLPRPAVDGNRTDVAGDAPRSIPPPRDLPRLPVWTYAPDDAAVSGWVIDTAGEPIADVQVTLTDGDGADPLVAYTAADGSFRFGERGTRPGTLTLGGPNVFTADVPWQGGEATSRVMATRRMSVGVRVTAAGLPVGGAQVTISDGSGLVADVAVTDGDGIAAFDDLMPGVYEVWARDESRVSPLERAPRFDAGPFDDVELALGEGTEVWGRVIGDDGVPLAGVVSLVPIDVDHVVRRVPTDDLGNYAVPALPRGRWRVEARAEGYVAGREFTVDAFAAEASLDVTLRRGATISGRVVDADGQPVAGAVVVLHDHSASTAVDNVAVAQTDEATFGGIRWIHPLAAPRRLPALGQRFGAHRPGIRAAECGRGHCGVDIGRERGSTIHAAADGTVIVASRESVGISGRFIVIEHTGGLRSLYIHLDELRSDIEVGQSVRAGEPIGTMGRTGFAIGPAHLHFAITQRIGNRRWYIDPEPMLRQAVVLPEAASLEGHLAAKDASPTLVATRTALASYSPVAATTRIVSDADGAFRLDGIAPSTYAVTAVHPDYAPGHSGKLTVTYGTELSDVTVRMLPGVRVYGRVVGPVRHIPGARIVAMEGEGESQRAVAQVVTDIDGNYELRALAGTVTLVATAQGYGRAETSVALGAGARMSERRVDFELDAADATLRAMVVDAAGFPVRAAGVEILSGPTARGRKAVTDDNGFFQYTQLAAGSYRVEVESRDFPTATGSVTTGDIGTVRMPQGGGLSVFVRDAQSRAPLADVRIDASGPGGAKTSVATNADGVCELVPLAPGPWTLRAKVAGYVVFRQVIQVDAGSGARAITGEPTLELSRGATVGGVVYDASGVRVPGARVTVGDAETTTDQEGVFRLTDVPTGSATLAAEADGKRGESTLDLAPGDELVTLSVELAE